MLFLKETYHVFFCFISFPLGIEKEKRVCYLCIKACKPFQNKMMSQKMSVMSSLSHFVTSLPCLSTFMWNSVGAESLLYDYYALSKAYLLHRVIQGQWLSKGFIWSLQMIRQIIGIIHMTFPALLDQKDLSLSLKLFANRSLWHHFWQLQCSFPFWSVNFLGPSLEYSFDKASRFN